MAQLAYVGFHTVSMVNGLSGRLLVSSLELCVSAASSALHAVRSSPNQPAVTDHPLVKDELEAMDIEAKIQTIQALMKSIQKSRAEVPTNQQIDDADVVGVCLNQVREVLESLTQTITKLHEELNVHETRWFSSWRAADTKNYIVLIRSKVLILDKRVDMLLKVRSFVNKEGGAQEF